MTAAARPMHRIIGQSSKGGNVSTWRDGNQVVVRIARDSNTFAECRLDADAAYDLADAISRILMAIDDSQHAREEIGALLP